MKAPPFDVMDFGRMAVVQDPTGADFSLWQPKKHIGVHILLLNAGFAIFTRAGK